MLLFIAVGCFVVPIVLHLEVPSSLESSIARAKTSLMSNLTSKVCAKFPNSLSQHISPITAEFVLCKIDKKKLQNGVILVETDH